MNVDAQCMLNNMHRIYLFIISGLTEETLPRIRTPVNCRTSFSARYVYTQADLLSCDEVPTKHF